VRPIGPLVQNIPLQDLNLLDSASFIVEPVMPVQTHFSLAYHKPPAEEAISYYSKIRPNGDMNVAQYLERKTAQYIIEIYKVTDPESPQVKITAPEILPVTELPELILFATKETFDAKRDTFQLFRRKVNSDWSETMPYQLRPDVVLKMLFVSELKRLVQGQHLRLYYDIVQGYSPEQLKGMAIRTIDIYDGPIHQLRRLRMPTRPGDPLQHILAHIEKELHVIGSGRLLVDQDGLVRALAANEFAEESALLRFDVIPSDQQHIKPGEFLVVASICRYSKNQDNAVFSGQSFLFKVIPGEVVDETRKRIGRVGFCDERLVEHIVFQTNSRILNGDENLAHFVEANDAVKVVLPDRAKTNMLLKTTPRALKKKKKGDPDESFI
jgi:hypothetical protein